MRNGGPNQKKDQGFSSGTACFTSLLVLAVFLAPRCQAQPVSPEAEADQPTVAEDRLTILAGDPLLMVVFDADASFEGVSRLVLAEVSRNRIAEAIRTYRLERSPEVLLRATWYAIGATLALVLTTKRRKGVP